MAIGKVGSFATDAPLQKNYIGEAMSEAEDNSFRYRAEQRLAQKAKKEEEDAKLKDIADWDGKFDPNVIGYSSIDSPLVSMAMKAKERAGNITRELYSPSISTDQKIALMSERNKLAQSFDIANQTPQLIKEKVKSLEEGIKAGKYNSRDVDFMENISKQLESGKYELNYDERGTPNIRIYDTDESGKPIGVLKETTLGDLVKSFDPKLAFNYEDYKDKTLKNVKPEEFGYQKGANVVKGTRLSEGNKQQAKTFADVIVSDPNKLYEAQYLFKEKDPEKLRAKLENDFITSISTGRVQSLDTGYLNYTKPDKPKEEPIRPTIGDYRSPIVIQPEDEEKGKNIVRPLERVYKKNLGFKKDEFKLQSVGGKYNNVAVETIGLNRKGVPFITGTYAIQKGSSDGVSGISKITQGAKEKRFFYDLGHTELNSVAQRLGYENGDALTYDLRKMNNYQEKPKQQAKPKETLEQRKKRLGLK